MKILLTEGFRRLEEKSTQGVFKLTQAMGGGKTHNLLAFGLLAKHPRLRRQVMGGFLTERLQGAQRYDRIAGFFSSSILEVVGEALESIQGPVRLSRQEVLRSIEDWRRQPEPTAP